MDNMQEDKNTEIVSALADGQLRGDELAHGVAVVAGNPAAREAWHTYHVIGDILRSGDYSGGTVPAAFMSRLQVRLQAEQAAAVAPVAAPVVRAERQAANDSSFRWKLVAGLASLAAVAAVGWSVVASPPGTPPLQPQLALTAPPAGTVLAGTERGIMVRDPRLDEFLAAHRQLGGASALQMPAGFLRNATYDGAGR